MTEFQRGDIVLCALSGDYGKPRPAVVVQSDLFNPTHASVTLGPLTTHTIKAPLFRISISPGPHNGLKAPSQIMVDKLVTIRRDKLRDRIGQLMEDDLARLDQALKLWLSL